MGVAESDLVDHGWITENGTVKYLPRRLENINKSYIVTLTPAIRVSEERQFSTSIKWLRAAAQHGCQPAAKELLRMLAIVSPRQLAEYLQSTSNQHYGYVQEEVGKSYENGTNGFPVEKSLAGYWYLMAAYNDSFFSIEKVESMYASGWGAGTKNPQLERVWKKILDDYWIIHRPEYFTVPPCNRGN